MRLANIILARNIESVGHRQIILGKQNQN